MVSTRSYYSPSGQIDRLRKLESGNWASEYPLRGESRRGFSFSVRKFAVSLNPTQRIRPFNEILIRTTRKKHAVSPAGQWENVIDISKCESKFD